MPILQCSLQPYGRQLVLLNCCKRFTQSSTRNKQASSWPHTRAGRVEHRKLSDARVQTGRPVEVKCSASSGGGGGHNTILPNTDFYGDDAGLPGGGYGLFGIVFTLAQAAFQEDEAGLVPGKHGQQSCSPDSVSVDKSPLSDISNTSDAQPVPEELDVQQAFAGQTVLLTGVTGFVGSIVLEQLLRTCPDIRKVYVIVRDKYGMSGPERLQHMLCSSPLFQSTNPAAASTVSTISNSQKLTPSKAAVGDSQSDTAQASDSARHGSVAVEPISGDMTLLGYGIAESDMHRLRHETDIVIHAAASISFDDHIHDAITHNYTATKHLADMACHMPNLKAFIHVSTAYVNGNQPKGSQVPEVTVPLLDAAKSPVHHASLVSNLQTLPASAAASQAQRLMQQWRFPNTYCFSKHLAESLVADYHTQAFPVTIVRPSIIGALAGAPLPGYVGNSAGSTGAALAIATGIAAWTCHQPSSIFDVVPGDLVSSAILAAAAMTTQATSKSKQPLVIHACTSSQNPLNTGQFFQHIQAYFTAHAPPFRVIMGPYPKYQGWNIVQRDRMKAARSAAAEVKFAAICGVLRAVGQPKLAKKMHSGWKAWQRYNSPALDFDLCFQTNNLKQLQQSVTAKQKPFFRLSWQGADWQRYLSTYMAGVQYSIFKQDVKVAADEHDFVPWRINSALPASSNATKAVVKT